MPHNGSRALTFASVDSEVHRHLVKLISPSLLVTPPRAPAHQRLARSRSTAVWWDRLVRRSTQVNDPLKYPPKQQPRIYGIKGNNNSSSWMDSPFIRWGAKGGVGKEGSQCVEKTSAFRLLLKRWWCHTRAQHVSVVDPTKANVGCLRCLDFCPLFDPAGALPWEWVYRGYCAVVAPNEAHNRKAGT